MVLPCSILYAFIKQESRVSRPHFTGVYLCLTEKPTGVLGNIASQIVTLVADALDSSPPLPFMLIIVTLKVRFLLQASY